MPKVLGWGACSVVNTPTGEGATPVTHNDIVENSTTLSVEEGQEQEATIEGGEAEGRKKSPDKYVLTYNRRIGEAGDVTVGFTENAGTVKVKPENVGAIGVELTGVSKHVAVKYDSTDGLVAVYTYKTKGSTDANGALDDIDFEATAAG